MIHLTHIYFHSGFFLITMMLKKKTHEANHLIYETKLINNKYLFHSMLNLMKLNLSFTFINNSAIRSN